MSILVGKKWDKDAHYIGRGSVLGNKFPMLDQSDEERNRVCVKYAHWLCKKIEANDPAILNELRIIQRKSEEGLVILGCFCHPKQCHGDFIKEILDHHINQSNA